MASAHRNDSPIDRFTEKLSDIATRITKDNLTELKFGCKEVIPDGKREKITSPEALFAELERRNKLSPNNRTFLVELFRRIGLLALANELENWKDLDTNARKIEELTKLGKDAHKQRNYGLECELYEKVLSLLSHESTEDQLKRCKTLRRRAASFIKQNEFQSALRDCNKVILQNPGDLKAKFLVAQCYDGLQQYEKAFQELQILKTADPKDPDVLLVYETVRGKLQLKDEETPLPSRQEIELSSGTIDIGDAYPRKFLFVCDKWSGWHRDIYSVNRHFCRHLAKTQGVQVACLVLDASENDKVEASKEGVILIKCPDSCGVPQNDVRLYYSNNDFPFKADIVIGHGIVTGAEAAGLAKRFDCKHLQIFYDSPDVEESKEIEIGQGADFVAAIGPQLVKEWSNVLDCNVIEIIPGIPSDAGQRSSIPTPHNRVLIVESLNNGETSALEATIGVLNDCKQRRTVMEVNIQGPPRSQKNEVQSVLESKLTPLRFKIHVTSDDASRMLVQGEMRVTSLLLMPSKSETFGVRGLEAISSGIPVLINNSFGIADVIIEHFDPKFWLFLLPAKEEDDYETWAERIDIFLDDRDQYFKLASELQGQWKNKFTWESATKKILQTLSESRMFSKIAINSQESSTTDGFSCSEAARSFVDTEVQLNVRRRSHILIVSPVDRSKYVPVRYLAKIPWIAVFDFDKDSAKSGYLASCEKLSDELGTKVCQMHCSQKVKNKVTLPTGIPWLLLEETNAECLRWLKNVISTLESTHHEPITILILWNASEENEVISRALGKLLSYIEASSLQERVKLAVSLVDGEKQFFIKGIEDDWSVKVHEIPLNDICNAINESALANLVLCESEKFCLPVADIEGLASGDTKILPSESRWINAELEILYQSVRDNPEYDSKDAQHFYRGGTISWYALSKGYAIERKNWKPVKDKIDELLPTAGTLRHKLFHCRGTGGTTSSRRILFEYHRNYPCVNVKSIHQETTSAIKVLADFCKLPVLVLVDCKHIERDEFDLDILYDSLSNQRVPCIVLEVFHRQQTGRKQKKVKESLIVAETLDDQERETFVDIYSELRKERLSRLRQLKNSESNDLQIPFYYALVTYEEKFTKLEPFIEDCLRQSDRCQRQVLIFLSMAHHYGHISIPESVLTSCFNAPRESVLEELLTESSLHLLLEEDGRWRPRHDLIGGCMMKHLLSHGIHQDNWIQNLADEAINFISHMPEKLVNLVLLNRAPNSDFSPLVNDIPDDDDVIKVFEKAIDHFPDNLFFKVHLGRVYSIKKEASGFEMSLRYTDEGIQGADRENSSKVVRGQFAQMKGVVYSRRVSFMIKEGVEINDIVPFAEQGVTWFRRSVSICPDMIDGYIPEVSMMCKLFEYVHQTTGSLYDYLKSSNCIMFIADGISQTSDTLECVPDSENYSTWKSRLLCLGLRKHSAKDLRETLNLLEKLRDSREVSRGPVNRKIADMKMEICRQKGKHLCTVADEVNVILNEALKYCNDVRAEHEKELTMRLWVQIAPFVPVHLQDAESLIFKWCSDCKSIRSFLYKFIIAFIHVLEGSKRYLEIVKNAHDDLLNEVKVINRGDVGRIRHPDKPVVWLGAASAKGMGQLVYLTERKPEKEKKNILAPEHAQRLRKLTGTIINIKQNVGIIAVKDKLEVTFRTDLCDPPLLSTTFCNRNVQFNLSFTYFGTNAYNVKLVH